MAGDGGTNQDTVKSDKLCNQTELSPGGDLKENVAWIEQFKVVNQNPTAGYSQHVNNLGLTTFSCVSRLSNDSVQRIILAGLEVLAMRSAQKAVKDHGLDSDKAPTDAADRLAAAAEFAKKRPHSILEAQMATVYSRVQDNAKRSGIILNLPEGVLVAEDEEGQPKGNKRKQPAGAA